MLAASCCGDSDRGAAMEVFTSRLIPKIAPRIVDAWAQQEPSASNKERHMPLVRINFSRTASPKLRQTVSDVVFDAMITVAKVPADDKFQIFAGHAADELVFPKQGYLGIDYTDGIIFIQVTWNAGRSTEVKKAFYRKIADDLHTKADVRKQDVFISLVDVLPENWSFGNGEMQYAPKQ
jgi:4-oxalocrotonate tautomerase